MHRVLSRHAIVPAAWLAVLSLAGCGDRDRSTMARDTATDTASADAAGKSAPLTDATEVLADAFEAIGIDPCVI